MTAALVIPAIFVEFALECMATRNKQWLPALVSKAAIWGTSVLVLAMLIGLTWGRGSLGTSWKSHTSVEAVAGMDLPKDHVFNAGFIKDHVECVIAGLAGIVLGCKWGRVRELAFPVTMLFTVCAVHAVHRPWWNYYYMHIAIPLAWLAGWMVVELARRTMARQQNGQFNLRMRPTWVMMGLCFLAALPLARSERRLELVVKDLRHSEPASTNRILEKMKIYAGQTKWVYAADGMYPFQARLPVPPELAIVMPKRFWSGQITTSKESNPNWMDMTGGGFTRSASLPAKSCTNSKATFIRRPWESSRPSEPDRKLKIVPDNSPPRQLIEVEGETRVVGVPGCDASRHSSTKPSPP
jgi:hypothetical protein